MHVAPFFTDDAPSFEPEVRIAVASGDPQLLAFLVGRLSDEGYAVVAFETGAELLQHLYNVASAQRPDLVICAAELEGIDGAQVCKVSRAQDPLLPFIVLARGGPKGAFDSLELSDDACVLTTPVDIEELRESVHRLAGDP